MRLYIPRLNIDSFNWQLNNPVFGIPPRMRELHQARRYVDRRKLGMKAEQKSVQMQLQKATQPSI